MRAATLFLAVFATCAHAEEGEFRQALPPVYRQECSSCHVPYPPGLLPAASWRRLMAGLPQHFGSDASLEPPVRRQIESWLLANASPRAVEPPEDRITRGDWFVREHRRVPTATWQGGAVRGPSDCAACHTGAQDGDFEEHQVRVPGRGERR